jgi:hypothetical protein
MKEMGKENKGKDNGTRKRELKKKRNTRIESEYKTKQRKRNKWKE